MILLTHLVRILDLVVLSLHVSSEIQKYHGIICMNRHYLLL